MGEIAVLKRFVNEGIATKKHGNTVKMPASPCFGYVLYAYFMVTSSMNINVLLPAPGCHFGSTGVHLPTTRT